MTNPFRAVFPTTTFPLSSSPFLSSSLVLYLPLSSSLVFPELLHNIKCSYSLPHTHTHTHTQTLSLLLLFSFRNETNNGVQKQFKQKSQKRFENKICLKNLPDNFFDKNNKTTTKSLSDV